MLQVQKGSAGREQIQELGVEATFPLVRLVVDGKAGYHNVEGTMGLCDLEPL